jgi:hypothetical protein
MQIEIRKLFAKEKAVISNGFNFIMIMNKDYSSFDEFTSSFTSASDNT